jgi:hypothetical protein
MFHERWLPQCAICKSAVILEDCKTDEYGRAVHEDCYIRAIIGDAPLANLELLSAHSFQSRRCFVRF